MCTTNPTVSESTLAVGHSALFLLPQPLCRRPAAEEASERPGCGRWILRSPSQGGGWWSGAVACPIASCEWRRKGRCCVGRAWRSRGSTWRGRSPAVCARLVEAPRCDTVLCLPREVLDVCAKAMRSVAKAKGQTVASCPGRHCEALGIKTVQAQDVSSSPPDHRTNTTTLQLTTLD